MVEYLCLSTLQLNTGHSFGPGRHECVAVPENDFAHVIKLQLLSLRDDTALSSSLGVIAKIPTRGGPERQKQKGYGRIQRRCDKL